MESEKLKIKNQKEQFVFFDFSFLIFSFLATQL